MLGFTDGDQPQNFQWPWPWWPFWWMGGDFTFYSAYFLLSFYFILLTANVDCSKIWIQVFLDLWCGYTLVNPVYVENFISWCCIQPAKHHSLATQCTVAGTHDGGVDQELRLSTSAKYQNRVPYCISLAQERIKIQNKSTFSNEWILFAQHYNVQKP